VEGVEEISDKHVPAFGIAVQRTPLSPEQGPVACRGLGVPGRLRSGSGWAAKVHRSEANDNQSIGGPPMFVKVKSFGLECSNTAAAKIWLDERLV
jgi:hypothetical protein